jgi:hypothetical protein
MISSAVSLAVQAAPTIEKGWQLLAGFKGSGSSSSGNSSSGSSNDATDTANDSMANDSTASIAIQYASLLDGMEICLMLEELVYKPLLGRSMSGRNVGLSGTALQQSFLGSMPYLEVQLQHGEDQGGQAEGGELLPPWRVAVMLAGAGTGAGGFGSCAGYGGAATGSAAAADAASAAVAAAALRREREGGGGDDGEWTNGRQQGGSSHHGSRGKDRRQDDETIVLRMEDALVLPTAVTEHIRERTQRSDEEHEYWQQLRQNEKESQLRQMHLTIDMLRLAGDGAAEGTGKNMLGCCIVPLGDLLIEYQRNVQQQQQQHQQQRRQRRRRRKRNSAQGHTLLHRARFDLWAQVGGQPCNSIGNISANLAGRTPGMGMPAVGQIRTPERVARKKTMTPGKAVGAGVSVADAVSLHRRMQAEAKAEVASPAIERSEGVTMVAKEEMLVGNVQLRVVLRPLGEGLMLEDELLLEEGGICGWWPRV